jgi:DNA modification methylase
VALPLPGSSDVEGTVSRAIERAGLLGITVKQIASLTAIPQPQVARTIDSLASREAISRVGRGLWVLRKFETVAPNSADLRGPEWYDRVFCRAYRLRIRRREGDIRFNPNERRPVHRWWPYVQGFSAGFVEETCRRHGIGPGRVVLDPFCGSGTVPVVTRTLGATSIGVDLMPITAFVAAAKAEWDVDPVSFWATARRVAKVRGRSRLSPPFLHETRRQFPPAVLASLLRLKESLWELGDSPSTTLLKLAFSGILIESSNLKRSPCLGYTRKSGLNAETPFVLFLERCARIREDLEELQRHREQWGPKSRILHADSGTVDLGSESVDLAITSPPYVNGMDYVMNYKLDLAWLGFVHSYADLARLRTEMVACDNIPHEAATALAVPAIVRDDPWVREVCARIHENIGTKAAYRREDMALIVRKYFGDLAPVISNVHRALKPGGRFVVVNGDSLIAGTYVPGDQIFARLASASGFEVESFEIARTRRSGQRRGFVLRESVLTLRKS